MTLVIAVGLVVAAVLYFLGKSHRELQRAKTDHPSSRRPSGTEEVEDAGVRPSNASAGGQESSLASHSPEVPETLPSDTSREGPTTLLQVFEAASGVAAGEAGDAAGLSIDASSLEEALARAGIATRRYRSGLLVSHGNQSAYLVVLRWDGHSKAPPPRTAERLLGEFETSGCDTMAIVTDAPHSYCRADGPLQARTPLVIPAEGIAALLRGLERLGRS